LKTFIALSLMRLLVLAVFVILAWGSALGPYQEKPAIMKDASGLQNIPCWWKLYKQCNTTWASM
jgi:hypothetical protein